MEILFWRSSDMFSWSQVSTTKAQVLTLLLSKIPVDFQEKEESEGC